jgi:isoleucyl-tRNA synthetase
MNYHAEARIAGELMKFAMSDQLYRGSKPVMWSVVERTALAEAEVEYQDYESDTIWVKFPVEIAPMLLVTRPRIRWPPQVSDRRRDSAKPRSSSGRPRRGRSPATAPWPIRRASATAFTRSLRGERFRPAARARS